MGGSGKWCFRHFTSGQGQRHPNPRAGNGSIGHERQIYHSQVEKGSQFQADGRGRIDKEIWQTNKQLSTKKCN